MRWFLVWALLAAAGCGKSFQEADAIHKDEVAKLEAIDEEWGQARVDAVHAVWDKGNQKGPPKIVDGKVLYTKEEQEALDEVDGKYALIFNAQKERVDQARKEKEAAK
jgi:hypothetical protein